MYNHYRHIVPAPLQVTTVSRISSTDIEIAPTAPAPLDRRAILTSVLAFLPFVVAVLMIVGFGIAIYPLLTHFVLARG